MDKEIKERVAAINSGIIPEGYKKTKVGIVPVEWEVIRFQDVTSKTGKDKNNDEIDYPVYSINNKTGFSPQDDQFENSGYSNTSKDLYKVVYKNEFAYNPARINVGSIGLLKDQNAVVISSLYVCFKMNINCNTAFFEQYFKSHRFNFDVNNYTEGSVREYLFYDNFSKIHTALPPLPEQQKIAEILSTQDKLIELQEKKIEQLKELKKAYLQKMFPKKGSKYPELRFKGFTDPWEQRKLNDVGVVIDPHPSHRAPAEEKGGIPFIGIGDVDEVGNINRETARLVSENVYDEHHRRYDLCVPSLGLGRVASLGKVIRLRSDIGKYAISPTMSVLQFNEMVDIDYMYAFMNSSGFKKQFEGKSNGSTRQSVGTEMVRLLDFDIPSSLEEQKAIGAFYKSLDNLITLHQRKSEQEKQKKKALMQLLLTGIVRTK